MSNAEVQVRRARISVRFDRVFFPIDFYDLLPVLRQANYRLALTLPPYTPGRVNAAGLLAARPGCSIDANTERGIIGIDGESIRDTMSAFEELEQVCLNRLRVKFSEHSKFFEAIVAGQITTSEKPVEVFAHLADSFQMVRKLGDVFEIKPSMFGLRIVPSSQIPNEVEWFDLKIEPDTIQSRDYVFEAVYRSKDETKVFSFMQACEARLGKLVALLEEK